MSDLLSCNCTWGSFYGSQLQSEEREVLSKAEYVLLFDQDHDVVLVGAKKEKADVLAAALSKL